MKIKIENYRNVTLNAPLEFEIKPGIHFVLGTNNIGKTNLLRFFYELRGVFTSLNGIFEVQGTSFLKILNRDNTESPITITFSTGDEENRNEAKFVLRPEEPNTPSSKWVRSELFRFQEDDTAPQLWNKLISEINTLSNSIFIGAERYISPKLTGSTGDVLVGSQLATQWSSWQVGEDPRTQPEIGRLILELKELLGFSNFHIQADDGKQTLMVTTDEGQFAVEELGHGISHIIIALVNAAIRKPKWIFIDEPEIGLHPIMQERFTRALAARSGGNLIAASHSVALAKSVADSISHLVKEGKKMILAPYGSAFSASIEGSLMEMNYSSYSELKASNIILIEGKTSVKVIKELLRKYGIEASFVPIPINVTDFSNKDSDKYRQELEEIKRLNPSSVTLIIDRDSLPGTTEIPEGRATLKKVCESFGWNAYITNKRATENYISQSVLDKFYGVGIKNNLGDDGIIDEKRDWKKEFNWVLVRDMEKKELEKTDFGKYIEEVMKPLAEI